MNAATTKLIANNIQALASIHGKDFTEAMLAIYCVTLEGLSNEQISRAFELHNRSSNWFPKPAELLELASGMSYETRATKAFAKVPRRSFHATWTSDDPILLATVRTLGKQKRIGQMSPGDVETWYRKEFVETYIRLCKEGFNPDDAMPLLGERADKSDVQLITTKLPPMQHLTTVRLVDSRPTQQLIGGAK